MSPSQRHLKFTKRAEELLQVNSILAALKTVCYEIEHISMYAPTDDYLCGSFLIGRQESDRGRRIVGSSIGEPHPEDAPVQ